MSLISFSSLEIHVLYYYCVRFTCPWEPSEDCTDKALEKNPTIYCSNVEIDKEGLFCSSIQLNSVDKVADAHVAAIFHFEMFPKVKADLTD